MVNIGKYEESYLLQRAQEIAEAKTTGSKVMNADAEAAVPRFQAGGKILPFRCFGGVCLLLVGGKRRLELYKALARL